MPGSKEVWTNGYLFVNGVDLSNQVKSMDVKTSRPEVEVTAMGDLFQQFVGGIPDATMEVEFYQSQAAGSVDATLWPLVNSNTPVTVEIRRANSARSTTNPGFVMTCLLLGDYDPLQGSVADPLMTTVTFRNASQTGVQRLTV